MQVFKCFFKITKKNLPSLSIYFFIFLALMFIFTQNSSSTSPSDYAETSLSIAVINRDNSKLGNALKGYMSTKHTLVELPDDKERLQDELFYRNIEYILIIPEEFETNMLSANSDFSNALVENIKVPNSMTGTFVDFQVEQYLRSLKVYLGTGFNAEEAINLTNKELAVQTDVDFTAEQKTEHKSAYYFYQYLAYIFIAIIVSGLSPILIVYYKKEIRQRNACSAMSLRSQNTQLALGSIIFTLLCWLLLIGISLLFYQQDMFTFNGLFSIVNALAASIVAMSIAFFLSMLIGSNALNAAVNTIGLGLSFLSGVFVPQQVLSEQILSFSRFLPTYWYISINDHMSGLQTFNAETLAPVWQGLLIQFGFALAFFAIALVISRYKKLHPKNI